MKKLTSNSSPSNLEVLFQDALDKEGIKYIPQYPSSSYLIDFAILGKNKLAIEVDGYYHQFHREYDRYRDSRLKRGGWTVMRFDGDDVTIQLDWCIEQVKNWIATYL